nr:YggT family protein [Tissierella sp.]
MINLYKVLGDLVNIIQFLILIRIVLSFININMDNPLGEIIYTMTEPVLAPARALIYKLKIDTGMFDFSPMLAIIMLNILYSLVARILIF